MLAILSYIAGLAIFIYWVCIATVEKGRHTPHPIVVKVVKISLYAVLIFAVIAIATFLTGVYFFGKPTGDTSYLIPIKNPLNESETMYANIVFNAEVIAAQQPLFASITIHPNSTWRDVNQVGEDFLPNDLLLVFDGAICDNVVQDFWLTSSCNVRLFLNNNKYTAGSPLIYLTGGEYRIYLTEYYANAENLMSTERFIQVESYQVTTEKTNVYVASMIGLASIGAAILLWWKRRS